MELPRDEMAFRVDYEQLVYQQSLTTVFRPGNRVFPNWRGYKQGEIITGRIIERCGCDKKQIAPVFNDTKIALQIAKIETIPLSKIDATSFEGSSWDITDTDSLNQHIIKIYNKPLSAYNNLITRIELTYLDKPVRKAQVLTG